MQDLLVLILVLAAAAYLVRHMGQVGTRTKPTGCGTCSDCPAQVRRRDLALPPAADGVAVNGLVHSQRRPPQPRRST